MDILVLGPLNVLRDGAPVYVRTGRKPRLVLAILASRAPHAASADALVEAVWGARPPRSARRNLQQYVQQLRAALGADVLVRQGDGYAVVADVVDAVRFRRLTAEGDAALAVGDVAGAGRVLGAALGLWRGAAFDGFLDCPALAYAATDLEQVRLCAAEWSADAGLLLGRHVALVPELAPLVRQHPYREGLRAKLMLALYRSGCRAEALAIYRHGRALLRAELGIEPGPELQRLHQGILRGDEALAALS
ncbi:BTAD domain-containing putative transcriptional regulator [Lentzea sp. NPDC051213]|uniref:AfsR/SARP family transcriptional regulator n=1 Tax=Lentzea sp. NPDC051213 TaxID=3364126 RepID=UPI0037B3F345